MKISDELIGLDNDVPNIVLGCDPGPQYCALALVARTGNRLVLSNVDYVPVNRLFVDMLGGVKLGVLTGMQRRFAFSFEKMTARYGAVPGTSVFDTCRNSGIIQTAAVLSGASVVYGVGTADWRVAFGGSVHMKDSEVRREIIDLFGDDADKFIRDRSAALRKLYSLKQPAGEHMRDAVGVAVGTFLMRRRGVPATERTVWGRDDA